VDVGCERSFLVRFGSVPLVRIGGVGLRFWHSDVFLFECVLFLMYCCYCLATKCPRCHEFGDGWNCVMWCDVAMRSVTMLVHGILHVVVCMEAVFAVGAVCA